jgi:hypothetical protein
MIDGGDFSAQIKRHSAESINQRHKAAAINKAALNNSKSTRHKRTFGNPSTDVKQRTGVKPSIKQPETTTKEQVTELLDRNNTSTDGHEYIIAIFNEKEPNNALFIKSSKPYTLSRINANNINIKGENMVFFMGDDPVTGYEQIKQFFNNTQRIIMMRMHDIDEKYYGLYSKQYVECTDISFDDKISAPKLILNYTLNTGILTNLDIDKQINTESTKLQTLVKNRYGTVITENRQQETNANSLPKIITTFRKYIEYLYKIPFMFKLNALTVDNIKKLYEMHIQCPTGCETTNIRTGKKILEELIEFSYITLDNPPITNLFTVELDRIKYEAHITIDTNNYKGFNDNGNSYIHVLHFIDLIEAVWKTQLNIASNNRKSTMFNSFLSMVVKIILNHNTKIQRVYDKLTSIDKYLDNKNIPLRIHVDNLLKEQNSKDIITYLKINNTDADFTKYNQRYCIHLNQVIQSTGDVKEHFATSMLLNYIDKHNFPYYTNAENGVIPSEELKQTLTGSEYIGMDLKTSETDFYIKKYDNKYIFGHYNRIFPLNQNIDSENSPNSEIAKQMPEITKQICENQKPVFMLGYGASGSGKTSSLIHLHKKDGSSENGVVVHLCEQIVTNRIIKETSNVNGPWEVTNVVVNIYEFFKDDDDGAVQTKEQKQIIFKVQNENDKITFVANAKDGATKGRKCKKDDEPETCDIGYNHPDSVKLSTNNDEKTYPLYEKELGEVLKELVDVDRLVRATPNNRKSSRSHALICIHFYKGQETNTINYLNSLIIGDLAGKENEFKCGDINTILTFLNEQIKDNSPNANKPFYSVLESIKPQENNKNTEYRIGDNKPVFTFSKPFESGHFVYSSRNDTTRQDNDMKHIVKTCLINRKIIQNNDTIDDNKIYEYITKDEHNNKITDKLSFTNFIDTIIGQSVFQPQEVKVKENITDLCKAYSPTQYQEDFEEDEEESKEDEDEEESKEDEDEDKTFSIVDVLYLSLFKDEIFDKINEICDFKKTNYVLKSKITDPDKKKTDLFDMLDGQCKLIWNNIKYDKKPPLIPKPKTTDNNENNNKYINESIYQLVTYHLMYIFERILDLTTKPLKIILLPKNSRRYDQLQNIQTKIPYKTAIDIIFTLYYKIREKSAIKQPDFDEDAIQKLVDYGFLESSDENTVIAPAEQTKSLNPQELLKIMIKKFVFYDNVYSDVGHYDTLFTQLTTQQKNEHYRPYIEYTRNIPNQTNGGGGGAVYNSALFPNVELKHNKGLRLNPIAASNTATFTYNANNNEMLLDPEFTSIILQTTEARDTNTQKVKNFYDVHKNTFHEKLNKYKQSLYPPANSPYLYWYKNTEDGLVRMVNDIFSYFNKKQDPTNTSIDEGTIFNLVIIVKYADPKVVPIYKKFTIPKLCDFLYKKYLTILQKYSDERNYIRKIDLFQDIFDSMQNPKLTRFNRYITFFKKMDYIINETVERIHYGKKICDERLIEGNYINSSLDTMRNTIKYILTQKHISSQALFSSPSFVDQCLKSYCPTGVNCFGTQPDGTYKPDDDLLFKQIKDDLISVTTAAKQQGFYKDIVLCIFGVFNISRLADNPPKVPYIDINNLKRLFNSQNTSIQIVVSKELTKIQGLLTKIPLISLEHISKDITKYLNTKEANDTKKMNLTKIIKEIDLHNASSSIGTLETLNTIAMLGDVDTLCDDKSIYRPQPETDLYPYGHEFNKKHNCAVPSK